MTKGQRIAVVSLVVGSALMMAGRASANDEPTRFFKAASIDEAAHKSRFKERWLFVDEEDEPNSE